MRRSRAAGGATLRDMHNYLVTCDTIDGEWSDPIFLNSSGFDPSLFHDDDGRKYLVNMLWDHRPGVNRFAGIVLQEYSVAERRLIGERTMIFKGTSIGFTEAPHLYKRDGCYYLITAEGGTGWGHAVTMARSRSIGGPYELHPDTYILSARHRPDVELQRAGHADLVETQTGETYMVYLCGRPLRNRGRCTLGRETAIQPMVWGDDGWLRTTDGQGMPQSTAEAPALRRADHFRRRRRARRFRRRSSCRSISSGCARRIPTSCSVSPRARDTCGCSVARRSAVTFDQSLVARRLQSHCASVATTVEFEPEHYQQAAGLVCYYNSAKFHYLYVSHDDANGKHLRVMSALPDQVQADVFTAPIAIRDRAPIELRAEIDFERLYFAYRVGDGDVAVDSAAVRREHPVRRSERAGRAEFHGRVRRHGVSGSGGHGARGGLRLVRVSRAGVVSSVRPAGENLATMRLRYVRVRPCSGCLSVRLCGARWRTDANHSCPVENPRRGARGARQPAAELRARQAALRGHVSARRPRAGVLRPHRRGGGV